MDPNKALGTDETTVRGWTMARTSKAKDYRVLRGPLYTPAQFARARRYSDIVGAVWAMGTGIVLDGDGRLVAFHESQASAVERAAERQLQAPQH